MHTAALNTMEKFTGSFEAVSFAPEAPVLNLILTFDTAKQQVRGWAEIVQSGESNRGLEENVSGVFNYTTVMGPTPSIIIKGVGAEKNTAAVAKLNFEFYMVLEGDFKTGTVNYWYSNNANFIQYMERIPVKNLATVEA